MPPKARRLKLIQHLVQTLNSVYNIYNVIFCPLCLILTYLTLEVIVSVQKRYSTRGTNAWLNFNSAFEQPGSELEKIKLTYVTGIQAIESSMMIYVMMQLSSLHHSKS